jgi:hypothetical protein
LLQQAGRDAPGRRFRFLALKEHFGQFATI